MQVEIDLYFPDNHSGQTDRKKMPELAQVMKLGAGSDTGNGGGH